MTLPADATQHVLPEIRSVAKGNGRTVYERHIPKTGGSYIHVVPGGTISIGFDSSLTWDELVTHVEGCIANLNFNLERDKGELGKIYVSSDRMQVLIISRQTVNSDSYYSLMGMQSPVPLSKIPENM